MSSLKSPMIRVGMVILSVPNNSCRICRKSCNGNEGDLYTSASCRSVLSGNDNFTSNDSLPILEFARIVIDLMLSSILIIIQPLLLFSSLSHLITV